jgi:hypothetical protein
MIKKYKSKKFSRNSKNVNKKTKRTKLNMKRKFIKSGKLYRMGKTISIRGGGYNSGMPNFQQAPSVYKPVYQPVPQLRNIFQQPTVQSPTNYQPMRTFQMPTKTKEKPKHVVQGW